MKLSSVSEFARNAVMAVGYDKPFYKKEAVAVGLSYLKEDDDLKKAYKDVPVQTAMLSFDIWEKGIKAGVAEYMKAEHTVEVGSEKFKIPRFFCFLNADEDEVWVAAKLATLDQILSSYGIGAKNVQRVQNKLAERARFIDVITPLMGNGEKLGEVVEISEGAVTADEGDSDIDFSAGDLAA